MQLLEVKVGDLYGDPFFPRYVLVAVTKDGALIGRRDDPDETLEDMQAEAHRIRQNAGCAC